MMKKQFLFLTAAGAAAGFVNGFFGTGGGIVLMLSLNALGVKLDTKTKFASLIAVIFPLSLLSTFLYGPPDLKAAAPYLPAGAFGGITGAFLLDRVSPAFLKKLFALLIVWAGAAMLFRV